MKSGNGKTNNGLLLGLLLSITTGGEFASA